VDRDHLNVEKVGIFLKSGLLSNEDRQQKYKLSKVLNPIRLATKRHLELFFRFDTLSLPTARGIQSLCRYLIM
jgi:hypothetical protein